MAKPTTENQQYKATRDTEISAIITIFKTLDALNFDQRVRTLRYIHERFGIRKDLTP